MRGGGVRIQFLEVVKQKNRDGVKLHEYFLIFPVQELWQLLIYHKRLPHILRSG